MKLNLKGWDDPDNHVNLDIQFRPQQIEINTDDNRLIVIELTGTALVVRGYDADHDEPVSLNIHDDAIIVSSDRMDKDLLL